MKIKILSVCLLLTAVLPLSAQSRQDAVRYYEEQVGTLNLRVKQLQDDNARLEAKVAELNGKQTELAAANQKLREEMAAIRQLVRKDAETRKAELQKLHAQLKQISEMPVPAPQPAPAPAPAAPQNIVYEEYVVEAGATLSAIAKAYGVSVRDIKKANGMKNDFLRVGRRLKIPVSK